MYAQNLPEPWEIDELERMHRIRDAELGERAGIPLYPPEPPPISDRSRDADERGTGKRVIVIELC